MTLTTLHDFSEADGSAEPSRGSIQAADGKLYGTTPAGGGRLPHLGYGTLFRIDTDGATFDTLHAFVESDGGIPRGALTQAADGNLYGVTTSYGVSGGGAIFKIDASGAAFTMLHSVSFGDGTPSAPLLQSPDGSLYGTTASGGTGPCATVGCGTIFRIDTSGSPFVTLHDFVETDGQGPGPLIQAADGSLWHDVIRRHPHARHRQRRGVLFR